MSPSRAAREEIRRYVRSRKVWTPVNIGDAAVAIACAVGFLAMVVL